jgi:hypothetical protein
MAMAFFENLKTTTLNPEEVENVYSQIKSHYLTIKTGYGRKNLIDFFTGRKISNQDMDDLFNMYHLLNRLKVVKKHNPEEVQPNPIKLMDKVSDYIRSCNGYESSRFMDVPFSDFPTLVKDSDFVNLENQDNLEGILQEDLDVGSQQLH